MPTLGYYPSLIQPLDIGVKLARRRKRPTIGRRLDAVQDTRVGDPQSSHTSAHHYLVLLVLADLLDVFQTAFWTTAKRGSANEQDVKVAWRIVVGVGWHTPETGCHHGRLHGRGNVKEVHVNREGKEGAKAKLGGCFDILGAAVAQEIHAGYVG